MSKDWRDEELLKEMYIEKGMTQREIADELGCVHTTVGDWLSEYNISKEDTHSPDHAPWQNEDLLREMYFDQEMNQYEIADELECKQVTITKWFKKYDIDTGFEHHPKLRDKEWLSEMYYDEELSQHEIADVLGCGQMSVSRWMDKYGMETRKANYEKYGSHSFNQKGYECFSHTPKEGCGGRILIHRLIMVAQEGVEAVKGKVVHHKNNMSCDNRFSNLELMDRSDHTSYHRSQN